jgi:hypothetical protein
MEREIPKDQAAFFRSQEFKNKRNAIPSQELNHDQSQKRLKQSCSMPAHGEDSQVQRYAEPYKSILIHRVKRCVGQNRNWSSIEAQQKDCSREKFG